MDKAKAWTNEEIQYLKNNVGSVMVKDMANTLGRSYDSVRWKIRDLHLTNDTTWTDEELEYLKNNFGVLTKNEIARHLNRTSNGVQIKANRMGLKLPEKYTYDVNFFENIDTEEKAYWLGFIMADGYIHQTPLNAELGIELTIRDIQHLKKFNKSLKGNIEVGTRRRWVEAVGYNKVQKYIDTCFIRLYRKKIVEDLRTLGITENKTTDISMPNIPDNLIIHLIRGYFDGDGSVYLDKRKVHNFNFTSASKDFLETLRKYIYNTYNISSYICRDKPEDKTYNLPVYKLYIRGMTNAYNFGTIMYKDATVYLDRKYELFNKITSTYDIINRIQKKGKYGERFKSPL